MDELIVILKKSISPTGELFLDKYQTEMVIYWLSSMAKTERELHECIITLTEATKALRPKT